MHVALFVLESKAHAMNYNRFKELSRNKRGLVRGEEVRRRNLKPRCGRKRSRTNREMKNCGGASGPLMLAGAERAALATTGGEEALVSDI